MNLADLIDRNAAFAPDKAAIRFGGGTLTYAALAQRIGETARALKSQLGIVRGDRVAILAANCPDYLVLLYACARLGAMLVPVNWRLAVPEQLYILRDAGVKALLLEQAFAPIVEPLAAALPQVHAIGLDFTPAGGLAHTALLQAASGDGHGDNVDTGCPLLIVYTSGTTGHPKGAVLRQEALVWNAVMSQHMHDMTAQDHVLTVLPLFHVGGLNIQTTPALQLGATVTLHARFAPEAALEAIGRDRPTLTVLVPATIQAMIEHPRWATTKLDSLRAMTTGSTQVPQRLVEAFTSRGTPVLQVYGSTETCPVAVYTRLSGDWRRPGSTGLPGLVCEARVVDDAGCEVAAGTAGEVVVRGPNVLCAYWGNPQATAETLREGWYYSGDIGVRDKDGHFYIHDRKKNLIISGGENIYPAEVERVLCRHPAVADAAVIGRADEKWQEVPVAYVVARPGVAAEPAEIERFCLAQLARYKVPREYVFVDDLPRNAMGKVQHFRLKERVGERAGELGGDGTVSAGGQTPATEQKRDETRRSGRWQWLVGGSR
ncbi:MAG: long-chain-fatty-acid--CoA ligase [Hyphomonadaceae bacterium]|jgi:fatty-acyl-CoA synthase|nr:long-chain-fatty-acid--CoA ligase [Hyphomonadaceae bacterium]